MSKVAGIMSLSLTTLFFCLSCAAGQQLQLKSGLPSLPAIDPPGLQAEASIQDAGQSGHRLWMFYAAYVDSSPAKISLVPVRDAGSHMNVLQFLEVSPCVDCIKIANIQVGPAGTLLVDISIRHPYSNQNLTGFDVRGIAIFKGSHQFPSSGLLASDRILGDAELVNADGYTSLYNPGTIGHGIEGYKKGKLATKTWPDATLNGFRRFVTAPGSNSRNAFYAGDEITVTYEIDKPDNPGSWAFGYAVDASWAPPIKKPVKDPITDFGPEANCPEAWKVDVGPQVSAGLTDCGGTANIKIDIYDWQGKDEVHPVLVECPQLFDGVVSAVWTEDGAGYTRYAASLENTNGAPEGKYLCLVSKEAAEQDPSKSWLDLSAYQFFPLSVAGHTDKPPTAFAEASKYQASKNEDIIFDASKSKDNDCDGKAIVKYEWDWMGTGKYIEGTAVQTHSYDTNGTYKVQLRITDDEGNTDHLGGPLTITIYSNDCPIAAATAEPNPELVFNMVTFSGDSSSDPDGTIVKYQWDWDANGTWDEEGKDRQHGWTKPGVYQVGFMVTDNEGCETMLDPPLVVEIVEGLPPIAAANASAGAQFVNMPIHFSAADSTDQDEGGASIVKYEWDWNGDGSFEAWDVPEVDHSWTSPGTYNVNLRVTDDEGQTDMLDQPIQVVISQTDGCQLGWVKRAIGPHAYSLALLPDYSIVVAGIFDKVVTFGEGQANETQMTPYGSTDCFIARYTSDGAFLWATQAGGYGSSDVECKGVTGLSDGSCVITGHYYESVTFGKGEPNQTTLPENGLSRDFFIARYNSDGTLAWARRAHGWNWETGVGITALSEDSVVVTGSFVGPAIFGEGEANETTLNSEAEVDFFIARYNPDGTLAWAKDAQGSSWPETDEEGESITAYPDNSFVVTGYYEDTITFGPGEPNETLLSHIGYCDTFIARFNPDGTLQWAKRAGGPDIDAGNAVTVLPDNSIAVAGGFRSTATFGEGEANETTLTIPSQGDGMFIARYNPDGTVIWAKKVSGQAGTGAGAIAALTDNSFMVVGRCGCSAVFGEGEPNETILYPGPKGSGFFIAHYNPDGTLVRARGDVSKMNWARASGVARFPDDSVAVCGSYYAPITFGPGEPNETSFDATGPYDIFIGRFAK